MRTEFDQQLLPSLKLHDVQPIKKPEGEFLLGRAEKTKQLGREVLGVIPALSDPIFGTERKEEIADYLSVSVGRVKYVTQVLQNEGHLFTAHGRVIAYFRPPQEVRT